MWVRKWRPVSARTGPRWRRQPARCATVSTEAGPSHFEDGGDRNMVGRPVPPARLLEDLDPVEEGAEIRRRPDMVQPAAAIGRFPVLGAVARSEEHTSELQSLMRISYAVFCLKKKT